MTNTIAATDVATANGHVLRATFFYPEGAPSQAVLIVPAMGVAQRYYAPLAAWLAERGCLVATFDYSGTGLADSGDIRQCNVDIVDWARFDCDAMLNAVTERAEGKAVCWIGHSLGGQILGFVPNRQRIAKVVAIAAGSGYWFENTVSLRWKVLWLWFVVAPVALRLFGYFPGKRLRKVGDLPRGVMEQWRRWCLNRDYAVGAEGADARTAFASVTTPITSLSFTDDEMMSARSTASLLRFYANAPRVAKRISPDEIGVKKIGHFGFFSARFERSLWQSYLAPELDSVPASTAA